MKQRKQQFILLNKSSPFCYDKNIKFNDTSPHYLLYLQHQKSTENSGKSKTRFMKIITIRDNYPPSTAPEPVIYLRPDSTLLKNGKPFFIPDFDSHTAMTIEPVFRLCRLGKAIPQEFADRYYDAVTVGINFRAIDLEQKLSRAGLPWEMSNLFDGSAVVGDFADKSLFHPIENLHLRLDIDGKTVQEYSTDTMRFTPEHIISLLGRYSTLKMGDLIYAGSPAEPIIAHPDMLIEGYLNGQKLLSFHTR